ncbi:unnamed protein product [Pocillopora meandrina]|uniref:Protein zer-1 homolog-like C-terminal domain-containing protein n=1 Tax=Pocillopora meandrina TaxID=46732 RepID=A0AAU9WYA8_9CNID|nr:unnamed protein product [Pocillopora meandrina]
MSTVSPASLEEICLSFISANIEDLCHKDVQGVQYGEVSCQKLSFISPLFLHEHLADNIMRCLSRDGNLTDRTASLFVDPRRCRIRNFNLRKCQLSFSVLKLLLGKHRVEKLDLTETKMFSSSLFFLLLNGMSSTVRELNLSCTSFVLDFAAMKPLSCLTHLDVSHCTPINDHLMSVAAQNMDRLQHINVSNTAIRHVSSFGKLRGQLKTLIAFNTPVAWTKPAEFKDFTLLQKLDISRSSDNDWHHDGTIESIKFDEMLTDQCMMPNLVSLDISGVSAVTADALQSFLSSHPKLEFLGLCLMSRNLQEQLERISPLLKITGEATEKQILCSLQMYPDRADYMREALKRLSCINNHWTARKPQILKLVLTPLEKHLGDLHVQVGAITCVLKIIREKGGEAGPEVHPHLLSKVASLVLSAMRTFPEKHQFLRICMLILQTQQIREKATFNYFEASCLVMDALCNFHGNQDTCQLAIKLCANLCAKLLLTQMEKHPNDFNIQSAAITCVGNIVIARGKEADPEVHPYFLSKLASLVLSVMKTFPEKHLLLLKCMSILGLKQVVTKATFNYFEASCLVMDALCNFRGNQDICQLAIQLCANLCAKLTEEEKLALGSEKNIMTMFNIIQEKISARQEDLTLSNAFTVLEKLTDETPSTCSLFVEKGGFQLMVQGLKVFREGSQEKNFGIKKDLLIELNIIAEVPSLRHLLVTDEFMNLMGSLLDDGLLQLSYFCGGILSNVMLEWSDDREPMSHSKQYLLHRLEQAVNRWEFPADQFVRYKSFRSFVPLLQCAMPAVQMWALWGIINVCTTNMQHYDPLLSDVEIPDIVQRVLKTSHNGVRELAQKLLNTVVNFEPSQKKRKS